MTCLAVRLRLERELAVSGGSSNPAPAVLWPWAGRTAHQHLRCAVQRTIPPRHDVGLVSFLTTLRERSVRFALRGEHNPWVVATSRVV